MREIFFVIWFMIFLLGNFSTGQAQEQTITATGEYILFAGMDESTAEERARLDAKRLAVEQVALYVSSHSEVKNSNLSANEVAILAAQILRINHEESYQEKMPDGSTKFVVKIEAVSDSANLNLPQLLKNRRELEEDSRLYQKLNELYAEQKRVNEELKRQYAQAQSSDPQDIKILRSKTQTNDKDFKFVSLMATALESYRKKNFSGAIELAQEALTYHRENSFLSLDYVYLFISGCYAGMKNYDEALNYTKKAQEINPQNKNAQMVNDVLLHANAAKKYLAAKDYQNLFVEVNKLMELQPEFEGWSKLLSSAYLLRGFERFSNRDFVNAIDDIENSLKNMHSDANEDEQILKSCYFILTFSYSKTSQYEHALEYSEKFLALAPDNEKMKELNTLLKDLIAQADK